MDVTVRPARPGDPVAGLLYASAAPYYDAYAGGARRARSLLAALYPRGGHAASWEICRVAEVDGRPAGVLAGFPVEQGDRLARRFVALTLLRLPPWTWPGLHRHLRAAGAVSPHPPSGTWYVDALAVDPAWRRRGIARELLRDAERLAGPRPLALDTGLHNTAARALYERHGFVEREVRRAPDRSVAAAVGGPGFVGYLKPAG